jgi:hypothetical protein
MQHLLLCNPGIRSFYEELVRRGEVEEARRYLEVCARAPVEKTRAAKPQKTSVTVQSIAKIMLDKPGGLRALEILAALEAPSVHVINQRLWRGKARGWFVLLEGVGQFAVYDLTPDGANWLKYGGRSEASKAVRDARDFDRIQSVLDIFVAAKKPFTMAEFQRKAGIHPSWFTRNKDWYHKVKAVQQSLSPPKRSSCISSVSFAPDI